MGQFNQDRGGALFAVLLAVFLSGQATAALVANRTVLNGGDPLFVTSNRAVDRQVDIHIGFMKGQGTPLFDTDSAGDPVPTFANVSLAQPLVLADFTVPTGIEPGLYVFYEVVTTPGGDPNNVQDWAFGLSSLSQLALYVGVRPELSGDFDDNGRPDDDANHDGFRDDDSDRDGLVESGDDSSPNSVPRATPVSVSREVSLVSGAGFPAASGKARYRARVDGVVDFRVEIEDVPVGSYQLRVDGIGVATINVVTTATGTQGEVEFRSPVEPGKLPLNFSPVGARIVIAQGAVTVMSADFPAATPQNGGAGAGTGGGNGGGSTVPESPIPVSGDAANVEVPLVNSGVQPLASGKARYRARDGRVEFKVEVEDLSVGTYTLLVGGVARGSIAVSSVPGGTEGEIEFRNPVEAGKVLLDFSPRGAAVEVAGIGGSVVLSIRFPD